MNHFKSNHVLRLTKNISTTNLIWITMKITFITTGGTIDKDYPEGPGAYDFEIGEPAIKRILENVKPNFDYEIIPVFKKDSLDITEDDRKKVVQTCKDINSERIIITHGSDTMLQSAQALNAVQNKVIVLTGAMRPEWFKDSNAHFNIGYAIGIISFLKPGVYIAMHGRVYPWEKCTREEGTGRFIESKIK
jgi:L-asparaginase